MFRTFVSMYQAHFEICLVSPLSSLPTIAQVFQWSLAFSSVILQDFHGQSSPYCLLHSSAVWSFECSLTRLVFLRLLSLAQSLAPTDLSLSFVMLLTFLQSLRFILQTFLLISYEILILL